MAINSRDLADEILGDFFGNDVLKGMSEEDRAAILNAAGIPDADVPYEGPLTGKDLSIGTNDLSKMDDLLHSGLNSTLDNMNNLTSSIQDVLNRNLANLSRMNRDLYPSGPSNPVPPIPPAGPAGPVPPSGSNPPSLSEEFEAKEKKEEEARKKEEEKDPMEELQNLVGLETLKKDVDELINLMKLQKMREERGMKTVAISKHLVFSGNPGTGKTTVARILAQLYKQVGILSKGQLVEVDRSGLVAGYVGQTAIKTQEKIQEAMGGILFVDEAYSLVKEGQDYGQEAIDTILKAMEDNRDDFVVIVAGYPDLMRTFIDSNPGLKSRFNKYFYFEDYKVEELIKIFEGMLKKNDYTLSDAARPIVEKHLEDLVANKDANFANARDVRNYFEHIINKQASRVITLGDVSDEDLCMITPDDLKFEKDVFHWAIIGSGVLAGQAADQLQNSEKHDIVSVYSRNESTRESFASKYQCKAYATAEEAIQAPGVDGVYVVTPHTSHYQYSKLALELGKPVLCEKPITVTSKEARELFTLAKEKNLYLAEAMWTWFSPIANRVKSWLDYGVFGTIKEVKCNFHSDVHAYAPRMTNPDTAGGALLDSGIYPITYLYRLFGKPTSVTCEGHLADGIDQGEDLVLTFENGLTVNLSISIFDGEGGNYIEINGSEASLHLDGFHYANAVTLKREGKEDLVFEGNGALINEFNLVAAEIFAGQQESIFVPAQATLDVMEILDDCRKQMNLVYPFEK